MPGMKGNIKSYNENRGQQQPELNEKAVGKYYMIRPAEDEILKWATLEGQRNWGEFNKSMIVRSLIRIYGDLDVDLARITSEQALEDRIISALRHRFQGS